MTFQSYQNPRTFIGGRIFKYLFVALIVMLLINATDKALQAHSFAPFIQEVGKNVAQPLFQINTVAKDIVANHGIASEQSAFLTFIKTTLTYIALITPMLTIVSWITLFMWIFGFFGANPFLSFLMASVIFYAGTVFYLQYSHATLTLQEMLILPATTLSTLIQAIAMLIHPLNEQFDVARNLSQHVNLSNLI